MYCRLSSRSSRLMGHLFLLTPDAIPEEEMDLEVDEDEQDANYRQSNEAQSVTTTGRKYFSHEYISCGHLASCTSKQHCPIASLAKQNCP